VSELVRAGGGVVWRLVPGGAEVVLVHRPAYDDWTFPKGKAAPEETDEQAAVREVLEETGLDCRLGVELPSTTYVDLKGRPKTVRYWAMTVVLGPRDGGPGALRTPDEGLHEVDAVHWEPLHAARRMLSYARDVVVLDGFEQLVLGDMGSNVRRKQVDDIAETEPQRK
jgi:8-oxo-dGTP pyrophosphatase MutT (NUDIX family)